MQVINAVVIQVEANQQLSSHLKGQYVMLIPGLVAVLGCKAQQPLPDNCFQGWQVAVDGFHCECLAHGLPVECMALLAT